MDRLADREAETLAAWFRAHPGVEIIRRDQRAPMPKEPVRGRRGPPRWPTASTSGEISWNRSSERVRGTIQRWGGRQRDPSQAAALVPWLAAAAGERDLKSFPAGVRRARTPCWQRCSGSRAMARWTGR